MKNTVFAFLMLAAAAGCGKDKDDETPETVIITASGDITPKLDQFRNLLGAELNTTPGQVSGRREINWDAVPDIYATQKLPSDFFNQVAPGSPASQQRGFIYSADADGRVSGNLFAGLDASNATEFSSFTGSKTFSALDDNLWNVDFEVPGQADPASVRGFGAVFSDVDVAGATTMEFFSGGRSLGTFAVPVKTTGTFSFLGVYFPNEKVTRVTIKQGEAVVGNGVKDLTSGGNKDLVILDDVLYDEPRAIQ